MVLVNSFPVWRRQLLVSVTGFCCYLLICLCLWVGRNLSRESSTEKKIEFGSETNEIVISFLSCKCNLTRWP